MRRVILCLWFLVLPSALVAESLSFDVRALGVPVGRMTLSQQGLEKISGRFATTGLAGALAKVEFDMRRDGQAYDARLHTGRKARRDQTKFAANAPRTDPVSALWLALRDRPAAQGCAMTQEIFDGVRTLRLTLSRVAGRARCDGQLVRVSGYPPAELAEAAAFPISIDYADKGGVWRAQKAKVGTVHGKATLIRR